MTRTERQDENGRNALQRRWFPEALVFCLSMALSFATYLYAGVPIPSLHDEFACLLQADTFAHGRLTNPPHPMAEHFQTFHVLQQPTYQAKFPPGYALFLAAGQILWRPLLGSWISIAVGCAAITWMLRGWYAPGASTLGGVLAVTALTTHLLATSYWGGGVAMAGGAMVCGACNRILTRPRFAVGIAGGLGVALLVNSRPFEGVLLCGMLAGISLGTIFRRHMTLSRLMPAATGAVCVLLPLLAWDGYYNFRVTGSPWQLPYALHSSQYMRAPLMYWQRPHTPALDVPDPVRYFHQQQEWEEYAAQTTWPGFTAKAVEKIAYLLRTYFYPRALSLALLVGLVNLRSSAAVRWGWGICLALPLLHIALTPWLRWIYFMPLLGLLIGATVAGLLVMDRIRFAGWRVGRFAVVALLVTQASYSVAWAITADRAAKPPVIEARAALIKQLNEAGGMHLVLVHSPINEGAADIVFNDADVDASAIVFARDLGPAANAELLAYYPNRRAWRFDETLHVTPYQP